jgi:hypothetical protein
MSQIFRVQPHPLGVVVIDEDNVRELLIEGESCCGIGFEELQRIAHAGHKFEIDDAMAESCRLKQL